MTLGYASNYALGNIFGDGVKDLLSQQPFPRDVTAYSAIYTNLKRHFENMAWFADESWRCSIAESERNCSFIMDKSHWAEYHIYFVTWVGEHEIKGNNIKVALIVEEELSARKEFVKTLEQRMENVWNDEWGYALRPKKRYVLCKKISRLDPHTLFEILEHEFANLKVLGSIIDDTIENTRQGG